MNQMKTKNNFNLNQVKMKKQLIALCLGFITVGSYAQKDELRDAEKAIKNNDFKGAVAIIESLDSMEETMDEKYKAQYYFLKGQAYGTRNIKKAAEAYDKLTAYEKQIGKQKYSKEAEPKLNELLSFVSKRAIEQYNSGNDYKGASENFYLTYQLSPKDTSFLYNAAVSSSLAKDYNTSLAYYKKLQELGYTGITTEFYAVNKATGTKDNLGTKQNRDAMVKLGQYSDPTTVVSESKKADVIKNIAYIYVNEGKTEEAMIALQEARKSDPKDINLLLNEAQLYIKLEKMDKFAKLMEEAIQLDPNNPTLFFNLGVVNQNEKKIKEALGYYKKAIDLKPDYVDAYMNSAVAILSGEEAIVNEMNKNLSNNKKYDELEKQQKELYKSALPFIEKADELGRTEDTVRSLMNIYDILEQTDKADKLRAIYKKMKE
jgi:tetratricopeptide (TPR) repeat protein